MATLNSQFLMSLMVQNAIIKFITVWSINYMIMSKKIMEII